MTSSWNRGVFNSFAVIMPLSALDRLWSPQHWVPDVVLDQEPQHGARHTLQRARVRRRRTVHPHAELVINNHPLNTIPGSWLTFQSIWTKNQRFLGLCIFFFSWRCIWVSWRTNEIVLVGSTTMPKAGGVSICIGDDLNFASMEHTDKGNNDPDDNYVQWHEYTSDKNICVSWLLL